jgi:threonine/homoserine/homoserine lactone efflux protein
VIEASWALFFVASLAVILTPGQDTMLVMSRSIAQGPAAGFATAAGVSTGLVGHTLLATLGLGALLQASDWLFAAFRLVGAGYVIYLGLDQMLTRRASPTLGSAAVRPARRLFLDGALSNLSNAHVVLFYFAFLPQFVEPSARYPALTIFALGVAYAVTAFSAKVPVALFAGWLSGWLRTRPGTFVWINRASGAILVALGLALAFERR